MVMEALRRQVIMRKSKVSVPKVRCSNAVWMVLPVQPAYPKVQHLTVSQRCLQVCLLSDVNQPLSFEQVLVPWRVGRLPTDSGFALWTRNLYAALLL